MTNSNHKYEYYNIEVFKKDLTVASVWKVTKQSVKGILKQLRDCYPKNKYTIKLTPIE